MRHLYATVAERASGELTAVRLALGHTDLTTTQLYLSTTTDRAVAAGNAAAELLTRTLKPAQYDRHSRLADATRDKENPTKNEGLSGGVDGTRTRGPRRDRPALYPT